MSLQLGSIGLGPLVLQPTLDVQSAGFSETNNDWSGHKLSPGPNSRQFFEQTNQEGLDARLDSQSYGNLSGRVSGIFEMTGGGLDASASNYGDIRAENYGIEEAWLMWSSGNAIPVLGPDALQFLGGRAIYRIDDGFLFYNGASRGGNRIAPWIAAHRAFAQSGLVRLNSHGFLLEGFYLSPNDHPSTSTRLTGVNLEYRITELLMTGFTFANIFHSQTASRQGLNVIYWRTEGSPLPALSDFYVSSSIALESNGNRKANALGWSLSPSYRLSGLRWEPTLYYRYTSFSGGGAAGNRDFDPLFYGMSDWGTWYQGDILGNWVLSNRNLNSHQARLNLTLNETSNLNLIYYHFSLDSRHFSGLAQPLSSKDLGDEVDLDLDFSLTNWWTMAIMVAANVPACGERELSGGNRTWVQPAIWSSWTL